MTREEEFKALVTTLKQRYGDILVLYPEFKHLSITKAMELSSRPPKEVK